MSSFAALIVRGLFPRDAKSNETRKFSTRLIYGHASCNKGVTKMKRLNTSMVLLLRLIRRLLTFPSAEMWPLFHHAVSASRLLVFSHKKQSSAATLYLLKKTHNKP